MSITKTTGFMLSQAMLEMAAALRNHRDVDLTYETTMVLEALATKIIDGDDALRAYIERFMSQRREPELPSTDDDLLALQMLRSYGPEFDLTVYMTPDGVEVSALHQADGNDPWRFVKIARETDVSRAIIIACARICEIRKINPDYPDRPCDISTLELPHEDDDDGDGEQVIN